MSPTASVLAGAVQLWGSHWSASPSLICKGVIYCQTLQDGGVARGSHVKCLNSSLIATDEETAITLFTPQLFCFTASFASIPLEQTPKEKQPFIAVTHLCN